MIPDRLSDRLRLVHWLVPPGIALLAAVYQIGVARFVHDRYGEWAHYAVEVLLYATITPIIIWYVLRVVRTWIEEKEAAETEVYRLNAELQQRVEERTYELRAKAEALTIANERLEELDRFRAEFVSLISHELRAPLTNVRGAVELMRGGCATLNATCSRMFVVVAEQIGRLERLIDDVLNLSRIDSGMLHLACSPVDLVQLAERAVHDFSARHTGHVFRAPNGRLRPLVRADPDWLSQVLTNLLDNAAKYSPHNGEVLLEVHAEGQEAVVSVSDSGPGIPRSAQTDIFEKFLRLNCRDADETCGYGLGLYVCRRVVEAMNGRIWVESEPGHGATFRFTLPLA